ncbi:hypothetical protein RYX36_030526 [Vicia faba]
MCDSWRRGEEAWWLELWNDVWPRSSSCRRQRDPGCGDALRLRQLGSEMVLAMGYVHWREDVTVKAAVACGCRFEAEDVVWLRGCIEEEG